MRLKCFVAVLIVLFCCVSPVSFAAKPQAAFTLYVYLSLDSRFQQQTRTPEGQTLRSLTGRLYFPKEKGKPVKIAYPDGDGKLQFSSLSGGSYLLEVHIGDQLLYQRKLDLESDVVMAVPIGHLKLVDRVTIDARSSQYLRGSEFNSNVILGVGDLDGNIGLKSKPIMLSITSGKTRLKARLISPKLATSFKAFGQLYIVTSLIRRTSNKTVIDCEVYK